MKDLKDLTADEKKIYDELESKELKEQYLKELKDDNSNDNEDDNSSSSDNGNSNDNNSNAHGDIDSLLDEEKKDLGDELDKKEDRHKKNLERQRIKDEQENKKDEKSSFLPYVLALAVVATVWFYVTKVLGSKGDEGINSVTEEYPTENYTESMNRETEHSTESKKEPLAL